MVKNVFGHRQWKQTCSHEKSLPPDQFPLDIEAAFGNHIYAQIGLFVCFLRNGSSVPCRFTGSVRQQIFSTHTASPGEESL